MQNFIFAKVIFFENFDYQATLTSLALILSGPVDFDSFKL